MRRSGRTTRRVDELVQTLFKTGSVNVRDHSWPGVSQDIRFSNEHIMRLFLGRLQAEHQGEKFVVDKSKMAVGIIGFQKKETNNDLFGEPVPRILFVAADTKNDNGFMQMSCGQSSIDNLKYVVTTNGLHADEIPDECTDAKTFAELVAKLLNQYYNKK